MKTKHVRPVLVESKEYSIIHKFGDCLDTHAELQKWYGDARPIYQELILISLEDERIEVGDEFYCSDRTNYTHLFACSGHTGNTHLQVKSDNEYGYGDWAICYSKKVIARQSQIPPEYIAKFIEHYNNGCVEDLEIEMETKTYQPCDNNYEKCGEPFNIDEPKLHNGFVIIVEKEYSHNLLCNMQYYMEYCQANGYVTPQDWLNKFKHYSDRKEPISYTEEEIKNLCRKSYYHGRNLI